MTVLKKGGLTAEHTEAAEAAASAGTAAAAADAEILLRFTHASIASR